MIIRTASSAILLTMAAVAAGAAEPQAFSRNFRLQLVDDSVWAHCEVEISRWDSPKGEQESECRVEDGKLQKAKRSLSTAEMETLTGLLREAALFDGQYWGKDLRGLDFSLLSITVDDGARVATVIASLNPSFENGPRKELLSTLMIRARESLKSSGPTKR